MLAAIVVGLVVGAVGSDVLGQPCDHSVDVGFRAGGANNWEGATDATLPYKDEFAVGADVTLDTQFQRISIDLSGATYHDVVSPFGWSITTLDVTEPIELYVDDVRWE